MLSYELPAHLEQLGADLDDAWSRRFARRRALPRRPRRLVLVLAFVAAFVVGGAAIAAGVLKTAADEEQGLLDGHLLFSESRPQCEQQTATSFRCTLDKPPTGMTFYEEITPTGSTVYEKGKWKPVYDKFLGVKIETVDSSKHIDGGCVSISADGRTWNCYLGQGAVDHGIISADLLGQYLPQPATG
jgi:hypothetical protein